MPIIAKVTKVGHTQPLEDACSAAEVPDLAFGLRKTRETPGSGWAQQYARAGGWRWNQTTTLVAGADELGKCLASRIKGDQSMGMQLVGFFDDRSSDRLCDVTDRRLIGGFADLPEYVRTHQVDVIFIVLPTRNVQRVSD